MGPEPPPDADRRRRSRRYVHRPGIPDCLRDRAPVLVSRSRHRLRSRLRRLVLPGRPHTRRERGVRQVRNRIRRTLRQIPRLPRAIPGTAGGIRGIPDIDRVPREDGARLVENDIHERRGAVRRTARGTPALPRRVSPLLTGDGGNQTRIRTAPPSGLGSRRRRPDRKRGRLGRQLGGRLVDRTTVIGIVSINRKIVAQLRENGERRVVGIGARSRRNIFQCQVPGESGGFRPGDGLRLGRRVPREIYGSIRKRRRVGGRNGLAGIRVLERRGLHGGGVGNMEGRGRIRVLLVYRNALLEGAGITGATIDRIGNHSIR